MNRLRILVTAGPTREHIDPVRFLSNPSTGKMGFALAEAARALSPHVALVSGPTQLQPPAGVHCTFVVSAKEMFEAVKQAAARSDLVLMCAAVSDWRPARFSKRKQEKKTGPLTLHLVRTPDILAWLGAHKHGGQVLVGFAAETHALLRHARAKLLRKNLDLIVANDISGRDTGFAADTNRVVLLWRTGRVERLPKAGKKRIGRWIVDRVVAHARMASTKN